MDIRPRLVDAAALAMAWKACRQSQKNLKVLTPGMRCRHWTDALDADVDHCQCTFWAPPMLRLPCPVAPTPCRMLDGLREVPPAVPTPLLGKRVVLF